MQRQADYIIAEKTTASFFVVPAAPAILVPCYLVLFYTPRYDLPAFGMIFLLAYLIAGAHVLMLGVPAFLLGRHFHPIRWWTCIIAAFIIGGLPITLLTWPESPIAGWQSVFLRWGFFGVSGGFVFWLLWRYWINQNNRANA